MNLWRDFTNVIVRKVLRIAKNALVDVVKDDGTISTMDLGYYRETGELFSPMPTPQTSTGTVTLTAAQMLGGVLVATPAAAAAYTVLTGALLEDALLALRPKASLNDSFDLTIINLGATTDLITLTADTGVTIVGDAIVGVVADIATAQAPTGTFRFRWTAADTFVAYRVS